MSDEMVEIFMAKFALEILRKAGTGEFDVLGGFGAEPDVEVVALVEGPGVAARDDAEIEFHVPGVFVQRGVGFNGYGTSEPFVVAEEKADFAIGAVGAEKKLGAQFGVAGAEEDVVVTLFDIDDVFDESEFGSGLQGLAQAEVVELGAHCHEADGVLADEVGGLREVVGYAEVFRDGANNRCNAVAKRLQSFDGEAAATGFDARELTAIYEQDGAAGFRQVIGRGAAGGTGADNQDVVEMHRIILLRGGGACRKRMFRKFPRVELHHFADVGEEIL